ncbi:MAG: M16 family metallopeptidase, partial [Lysobacterales bacterium]
LDESTMNRTSLEIDATAESLGAELSSGSNLDMSTVSLSALTANLAPSIELLADVTRNPAFAPEELERMRVRRIAAVEYETNDSFGIALRTLPPLIYGPDHAYGIPFTGSGTAASNQAISRDDLVKFHHDWLRPDNATLFVVGDTTLHEVLPMLEAGFGDWTAPATPLPHKRLDAVPLQPGKRLFLVDKPGSPQSLILAAHLAPSSGASNNLEIELMNDIIGGIYSARVNQNLRFDKHWSYGAYTFLPDARGQRPWLVYAPVQTDRTADAVRELGAELDRFLSADPANDDELSKVAHKSSFSLPGQYETNDAVLAALLANSRFNRPDDYVSTLTQKYQAITLEDVQAAAREVLHPGQLTWVIVGDSKEIRASLQALDKGPVLVMNAEGELE